MFARSHKVTLILMVGLVGSAFALTACGAKGSSGTQAPPTQGAAAGPGCAPAASDTLVLLSDDKHLQNSDNVVAVANKAAGTPTLMNAVDKVGAALDQQKLLDLNKATDIDRKTSAQAAQDFATANNLTTGLSGGSGKVVVGAANFPESETLAELYRIVLTAAGYQASVLKSSSREVYEPAIEKGDISVFPEYAATLTDFLNQKKAGKDATTVASGDINTTMSKLTSLAGDNGLVVGKPSSASDQNAFAVTKPVADQYKLKTLSDFATKCSGPASVLGGPAECPQRPYCQIGLNNTYKITFGSFFQTDTGGPQAKTALKTGKATLVLVFSSDSSLTPA